MMKLSILGSGTCVPSLKRNAPAYFLEAGGREVLVDCGSGTLLQLEKINRSYKDLDAVFITHPHPDHVADIIPLIHAFLATPMFKREKDLFLVGPKGLKDFYEHCVIFLMEPAKQLPVQIIEIEDKMDYPPFRVFTARTVHSENSIAYRFELADKSLVITGDADYDNGIVELSKNADILIADAAFPESLKRKGHMTPKECGMVAKKAEVKKLILSHLHELTVSDADKLDECRQVFDGDVSLAEDFMEINL